MKIYKKSIVVFIVVLLFSCTENVSAQLVNIESRRIQTDSIRFTLIDNFTFSYNDNNGNSLLMLNNTFVSQLKTKNLKNIFLFLGNYKLIRTNNQDFLNVLFGHVRYNRKLSKLIRVEAFVQYQRNPVLDISARELAGAGLRFKIVNTEHFWAYLGSAYMFEYEQSDKYDQTNKHHRSSNYLSITTSIFPIQDLISQAQCITNRNIQILTTIVCLRN